MRHNPILLILVLILQLSLQAQAPRTYSPSDIYHAIQKLNFLGSALYVAAHPDDENTRLISHLSNEAKARTAYLSLTRGDGGQNMIGPELRELLGVLRTQELLAARRVDGGEQFFSRANDFGYSKTPKETLAFWDKETVLSDMVRIIRQFKPDIIVNRFDHRSIGTTHGHHTASAMLALEAFDLAGKNEVYPQQLASLEVWQPRRLFFNTSWWFYGSREKFEEADKSNLLSVDTGTYYPMLGKSNNEIAALASSQHLCQGFGRLSSRGSQQEYLELLKGDLPADKSNLFEGIDTSWTRIDGGAAIGEILEGVENNFNFKDPSVHLPELVRAYSLLQDSRDKHWKRLKSAEIKDIITAITGLFLEGTAASAYANPGEEVVFNVTALNRSKANLSLAGIAVNGKWVAQETVSLPNNIAVTREIPVTLPEDTSYTSPYWLTEEGSLGSYTVTDASFIGKPETPRAFHITYNIKVGETIVPITKAVVHKYARPDKGELYEPFEVVPQATVGIQDKVIIFSNGNAKQIPVTVKAHADKVSGTLHLKIGPEWGLDKTSQPFAIAKKGDEQTLFFNLMPPSSESEVYLRPQLEINGNIIDKEMVRIAYDHVPTQTVLLPSKSKVVRLDIKTAGKHIGYIMGAGDKVPLSLEQMGYHVTLVDPGNIAAGTLNEYDAVILGIRAYNVVQELQFKQRFILDYAKSGGTVIVQYNTANRWGDQFEGIAPYPLNISRDRVTDEASEVAILAQEHPIIHWPNPILTTDFNGWVQERGLYFPNEWADQFTPILQMRDEGEDWKKGSLLVAPYGKGHYIYTGLSFFRELPAGVPGAYKLFANMISLGKKTEEPTKATKR
ncbi:PIG-L family deacetylase [Maribacter sp. 2307ULW6-5]|uniref:PIG-L family deacetylase n=1 Tax=Maribacter sp. 2307ULW6-5 TaxID=3386275 RepID=UPI0039BD429F